jgi:hypothetical protein
MAAKSPGSRDDSKRTIRGSYRIAPGLQISGKLPLASLLRLLTG